MAKTLRHTLLLCALTTWISASPHAAETRGGTPKAQKAPAAKTAAHKPVSHTAKASPGKQPVAAAVKHNATAKPAARQESRQPVSHINTHAAPAPAVQKVLAAHHQPDASSAGQSSWQGPLSLASASVLVLDSHTGESLYQKNPGSVMPIASISKLMTAMVVLDAGLDLNEIVTIGAEDVDTLRNSHSRLPVGASMTRETALLLALMSSDNRAAHALSRHFPGGIAAFVVEMNRKAQALGMTDTRFEEPTGLSSNNVSTARDLARMVSAAGRYNKIRELSTTGQAKVMIGKRELEFRNSNVLVRNPDWEIGVSKTGYITEAGRCLVMQARVAERPVIIVLLDSAGKMTRVGDAARIKRWMEQASVGRDTRGA